MTSDQYDDILRKLQLARDEVDLTQKSIDELPAGANTNEALVTVADALWVASEVLEFYEDTNELPEECRAVMLDLLRGLHHMVLMLRLRGRVP
jgi:hypothetical protein